MVYLASVTVGKSEDNPSVVTIYGKVQNLFSTWKRRSSVQIPAPVCNQVLAYFRSPEFKSITSVTTKARAKHVAHTIDVEILLKYMWADCQRFRTLRERLTCISLTTFQSITNDRPGAFTTSSNRPDCTDSILYRHCEVRIHPNLEEPRSPHVFIFVKITDIKNAYFDDSVFKYVILYPEEDKTRFMCPVTPLISIFLDDDAFLNVHTAAEIFYPLIPPTHAYTLPFKPEWAGRSVFRRPLFQKSTKSWETHPTDVITYNQYLKWLSFFSIKANFHCESNIFIHIFTRIHNV